MMYLSPLSVGGFGGRCLEKEASTLREDRPSSHLRAESFEKTGHILGRFIGILRREVGAPTGSPWVSVRREPLRRRVRRPPGEDETSPNGGRRGVLPIREYHRGLSPRRSVGNLKCLAGAQGRPGALRVRAGPFHSRKGRPSPALRAPSPGGRGYFGSTLSRRERAGVRVRSENETTLRVRGLRNPTRRCLNRALR
jgi:hypothetical protein